MGNKVRLEELDALRGLAALAVVLYHYTTRYGELFEHEKATYFSFDYGYLGVNLFFMISGFVIFMTMKKTDLWKDFARKRALRLYPAYIVSVIITFAFVKLYGLEGREVSYFEGVFNLTMLQGFVPGISHVDGVYWSLTAELTFYVIIGLVIFWGIKKRIFIVMTTWLVFSFLIQGIAYITENHIIPQALVMYSLASYSHLFVAGGIFYLIREKVEVKYYVVLLLCLLNQFTFNNLVSSIITVFFFFIFYLMINNKMKIINIRPLTFLGGISYSLYLIHQNLGYIVIEIMENNGLLHEIYMLIPLCLSIILATFLTNCIEKPTIKVFNEKMKQSKKTKNKIGQIFN